MRFLLTLLGFCIGTAYCFGDIVINEIHYDPVEQGNTTGSLREFIEIYNSGSSPVNLYRYSFTDGVDYTFPAGSRLAPGGYAIIARTPSLSQWRNRNYPVYGPYSGKLSNEGETLTLTRPDGTIVDQVPYRTLPPWSLGANGYGSSLERISPELPSYDYHSWRASLNRDGSPGARNSVVDVPPYPMLNFFELTPKHPTSADPVQLRIALDAADQIASVTLQWETNRNTTPIRQHMKLFSQGGDLALFRGKIPPMPNQTLVRWNIRVSLKDGTTIILPHIAEPRPFESYFVYDHDIPARLPLMWLFTTLRTNITESSKIVSAIAIKPADADTVQLYDGAQITSARNGHKLKFLKGREYEENRTLNLSLESPVEGTTAGGQSPHVEHISYGLYKDFGVLAPEATWYRVITNDRHSQRLAHQQPNEQFLKIHGRNPDGNIYKIAYNEPGGYSKMTNQDEGMNDYLELFQRIRVNNPRLARDIERYLDVEEVMNYQVVSFILSHWDGIKNNIFLYHDPAPNGKWEIIPWDVDKTFGYTDTNPMFWKMPIDFYITGIAPGSPELIGRDLNGPISRPFHSVPELQQEFVQRVAQALDGLCSIERVEGLIENIENLLLQDLELIEEYTGSRNTRRRTQITTSYDTMRFFLHNRHEFLRTQLPSQFVVTRLVPSTQYSRGSLLENFQVILQPLSAINAPIQVAEQIPESFTPELLQVTHGTVQVKDQTIIWNLDHLAGQDAILTYHLRTADAELPRNVTLTGSVTLQNVKYAIGDTTLTYLPANRVALGDQWVTGSAGEWWIEDGVLSCFADSTHDPRHVWVNQEFSTGDYTVRADVRMLDWQNHDLARGGIAVRVNPQDGERALNLLFHNDLNSMDMLNDHISWGTEGNYQWQVGEWYTMTLSARGSHLEGTIRARNTNETPYAIEWDDPRNTLRSPGYPGLTGSTLAGLTTQFDNFEVLIDGEVVFSDDFERLVGIADWALY
jgi:hypothetical protein